MNKKKLFQTTHDLNAFVEDMKKGIKEKFGGSNTAFATRLGVHPATVSNWKHGKGMTMESAELVAMELDLNLDDYLIQPLDEAKHQIKEKEAELDALWKHYCSMAPEIIKTDDKSEKEIRRIVREEVYSIIQDALLVLEKAQERKVTE